MRRLFSLKGPMSANLFPARFSGTHLWQTAFQKPDAQEQNCWKSILKNLDVHKQIYISFEISFPMPTPPPHHFFQTGTKPGAAFKTTLLIFN